MVKTQEEGDKAIHRIPILSSNNILELSITNLTEEILTDISIEVDEAPGGIKFKKWREQIRELKPNEEYISTFVFSTDKEAVIGAKGEIKFRIKHSDGIIVVKDFSIVVTPPEKFELYQNFPNPFNSSSTISYQLPYKSLVILKIYDLLGREVATLVCEYKEAGYYEVSWDATNVPSGIYIYRLQAGNFTSVKKMVVMK